MVSAAINCQCCLFPAILQLFREPHSPRIFWGPLSSDFLWSPSNPVFQGGLQPPRIRQYHCEIVFILQNLGRQYVTQVEICLNRKFVPVDCPPQAGVRNMTEGCISDMPLTLPPIQSGREFPDGCVKNVDHKLYFRPQNWYNPNRFFWFP